LINDNIRDIAYQLGFRLYNINMNQSLTIKINAWIICAILVLTNIVSVFLWQPWNNSSETRTITVTGSAVLEAEPDQYVFTPYYQEKDTNKSLINSKLGDLSKTILAKLKNLGVSESSIKTNVNTYDYSFYEDKDTEVTGNLSLTITIKDKELAQKVEDYLVTTEPSGSITPHISFSNTKQKELEAQARTEALKDAKSKADSSVKQLNVRLGKAQSVSDISSIGFNPWYGYDMAVDGADTVSESKNQSYEIQPGLDEYSFSIQVVYEIK